MDNTRTKRPLAADLPCDPARIEATFESTMKNLRLAEAVLESLTRARDESEAHLSRLDREDPIKSITGKSAFDEKIKDTQRMVDSLRRVADSLPPAKPSKATLATA